LGAGEREAGFCLGGGGGVFVTYLPNYLLRYICVVKKKKKKKKKKRNFLGSWNFILNLSMQTYLPQKFK
jgi:hypothetical protein